MAFAVVSVFVFFFLLQYAVETALLVLNLRHAAQKAGSVPAPLAGRIDAATAERSRAYTLSNGRLALLQGTYSALLTLAVLFSGALPALDASLGAHGIHGANRFVAFLALLSALFSIASLPFSLYRTFVLEARFGFNRVTWRLWLADRLNALGLAVALGVPLLYAVYAFMATTGRGWWLWVFAFLTAVQVVMLWLYPALIAPLFNKFSPLPEGELRSRLEALALEAGFRNRGLFVMDASKRSRHSNAYFTGILRPRIVLYDTLVERMSVDEAVAVLAHEIGHYRAHHVHKRLVLGLAETLVSLWILSLLVAWPPLFQAFGFALPSYHAAVALLSLGGGAFTFFLEPLSSWLSRRNEYEADRFSVRFARQPKALESALVKLNGENLSNLHPHPWYSRWHYCHPTLLERIAAIRACLTSSEGKAEPEVAASSTAETASQSR
jgi:STE24 endopeptidase